MENKEVGNLNYCAHTYPHFLLNDENIKPQPFRFLIKIFQDGSTCGSFFHSVCIYILFTVNLYRDHSLLESI